MAITILQDFNNNTSLTDNFTQSSPVQGTFTWSNSNGLNGSPGIDISLGSDQIWTSKQAFTISQSGEYTLSTFFKSSANNGYGAVGFSIASQDSNQGDFGAPLGSHFGAFFHAGGGGFLNNGAINNDGTAAQGNNQPITWTHSLQSTGVWYKFIFGVKAVGNDQFDLSLKIYNSDANGNIGSLVTEHSLTDDTNNPSRVGPAVTNTTAAGAQTLHVFFSAEGTRMTAMDNYQISLAGDTILLQPGPPVVDLNGSDNGFNRSVPFTKVTWPDNGGNAVSFTSGTTNIGDADSPNLDHLLITLPVADVAIGDELRVGSTIIDLTNRGSGSITLANNATFNYTISDNNNIREILFISTSNGGAQPQPITFYESLLDSIKYNNASDSLANINSTRTFSISVSDGTNTSNVATLSISNNLASSGGGSEGGDSSGGGSWRGGSSGSGSSGGGSNNGADNATQTTIDGVIVKSSETQSGSITINTISIPIVTNMRVDDPITLNKNLADIPIATDTSKQALIEISIPVGVGFSAETFSDAGSLTLREKIIAASNPKITNTEIFDQILKSGIDPYVDSVIDESQVVVRSITFETNNSNSISDPIIITGALGTGEADKTHPLRQEVVVIDARKLPSGTELRFNDTEFAIVIGAVRIIGGDGKNFVVGDDANQFIVLGADDDVLDGGKGDDTIGSKTGDDYLIGGDGNDYLVGGGGNDRLEGGAGNDLLQGGLSNAGALAFQLNNQGKIVSTLTPRDDELGSALSIDWLSDKNPLTNDNRVAFVYRDMNQVKTIATLYQAALNRLPTADEMNDWSAQELSMQQLGQIAYDRYVAINGIADQPAEVQLTHLINHIWGVEHFSDDWISTGATFLNDGGSWSNIMLFMVSHVNLTHKLMDSNGAMQLTQNLQLNELSMYTEYGNDSLYGGDGDDILTAGYGHNLLDGGSGTDSVQLVEPLNAYTILLTDEGLIRIERVDHNAIFDLVNIEQIQFSDQALVSNFSNLSTSTLKNAATTMSVMGSDSMPIWDQLVQNTQIGESLSTLVVQQMQTEYFQNNWQSLSNIDFVNKLGKFYTEVPLAHEDLAYWTDQLDQNLIERADLLVAVIGSDQLQSMVFAHDGLSLI